MKIDYLELPARNMDATKEFFKTVFNWQFEDFGPDYASFENAGISGGFYTADLAVSTVNGSALVVFYSEKLEETESQIVNAGGKIIRDIFSFPGGRRFHFADPNGNEFAVWGDPE